LNFDFKKNGIRYGGYEKSSVVEVNKK
jgi:hypothetical protein